MDYYQIIQYLSDNGVDLDPDDTNEEYFTLKSTGNGVVFISEWFIENVDQPEIGDLPTQANANAHVKGKRDAKVMSMGEFNGITSFAAFKTAFKPHLQKLGILGKE